jgi:glycerol-3-phosphate dehydrogenase subunit B
LQTAGGPRLYAADVVLLATGGVLHGGLIHRQDGHVQESVFDLPVHYETGRVHWTSHSPIQIQPFSHFGLHVDDCMQPLGTDGCVLFENLFAAGGLIAGADRAIEGSRQGIDLATAFRAVEVALA